MGVQLQLILRLVIIVALAHSLSARMPNWLYVVLPALLIFPNGFRMETDCDWWWAPLPEWLSAIATVVGVVLAYLGFNSWKVQYVAQKDYELAAQIVSNLYEIKRVLALIIVDGYKREYRLKLKTSVGELTRTLGVAQTLLDEDFSWALMELDGILGKFYFSVDGIADVEDEKQMPLGETFGKKLSDDVDAFETKVMGQIKPKLAVLRKTLYKPKLK